MQAATPHVYFASDLDRASEWQEALSTQFERFRFSTGEIEDPQTVDVALVWKLPEQGLDRFTGLKAILSLGAGVNQLEPARLPPRVPLARLVDRSLTLTMVDYAKAAVYRYHRCFDVFEEAMRHERWHFVRPKLPHQTSVGILGLGELGRAIADVLQSDGFQVRGWSRTLKQLQGVETYSGQSGLHALVSGSDIVVNVLPLTDSTRNILRGDLFRHFRHGAKLINIGRGEHLVEADLLRALDEGRVGAATLDVAVEEPLPVSHPFWGHRSILVTPHVAGLSLPSSAVVAIAANIRRALAGEPLHNQVDLGRGY
ncbi:2-hydroxyacid dehydrogenase [Paraburkholderia aspalathi]|uniref:2-hydroxyacid dehydrogenase n=1 Tax=Paraburkholderia aspalathi TaxID=1324617 RepID=UPI0038B797D7